MVWDIDLIPISNPQFRRLRDRLLISYVFVVASTLGLFSAIVYGVVVHDRNHQLNSHLQQLADSAMRTLELIQHEYEERNTEDETLQQLSLQPDGSPRPITLSELMGAYRAASIVRGGGESLPPTQQGLEWYNAQRQLIVHEGSLFPDAPLPKVIPARGARRQNGKIRSVTIAVDVRLPTGESQRIGYVRASESTVMLRTELRRLRWGLGLGGITVAGLTALSGIWLTRESLKPVVLSFKQLQQFTSDASHELRNPLTAIRASVAVMQSHPERIHEADIEKLRAIASASAQMSQMVDDLLLLARMDSQMGDRQVWHPIALDELLEDLVELYGDRLEQAGLTVKSHLIANLSVQGDGSQLQRLFTNLLTNAMHYTPAGGTIAISLQPSSTGVLVQIADSGIGIAPDHLPYIFDRFWRAESARSPNENGSGLGLSIVQAIAHRHGGHISVQSTLGVGSCFQVWLPIS